MAAATAKYYFRFPTCWCHCLQKVQVYQQTKFCEDTSIGGWDISTSDFEIETSTILEFYFRFRSRPVRSNMRVILFSVSSYRISSKLEHPLWKYDVISISQDGGLDLYYFRFRICWCHCLQKVKVYQQTKFRPDISIVGWDITSNHFRLRNTNVRHIGILLPVSISTSSP